MLELYRDSFLNPRQSAGRVLGYPIDVPTLLKAALALACAFGAVEGLAVLLASPEIRAGAQFVHPLVTVAITFLVAPFQAYVVTAVGRMFGGNGSFEQALKATVWLSVLAFPPSVLALLLGGTTAYAAFQFGLAIWLLVVATYYVMELHGFENFVLTLMAIIIISAMLGLAILVVVLPFLAASV